MEPSTPSVRTLEFVTRGNNKLVRYALSEADYATLARAVEFEGPPQVAVAWTLIQRFAYVYPTYKRLQDLISAYCQPINPAWFPDGKAHKAYVKKLRADGDTAEAEAEENRAKRRVWQARFPLENLSATTINAVNRVFVRGGLSPVPGSIHFRAPQLDTSRRPARPYEDVELAAQARAKFAQARGLLDTVRVGDPRRENWFFSEPAAVNVRVHALVTQTASIVGVLILLSTAAIWWAARGA